MAGQLRNSINSLFSGPDEKAKDKATPTTSTSSCGLSALPAGVRGGLGLRDVDSQSFLNVDTQEFLNTPFFGSTKAVERTFDSGSAFADAIKTQAVDTTLKDACTAPLEWSILKVSA